jgi:SAM-dependent methyltransferase
MRHDWDERARENALYYIATDSADSEETFAASGEKSVQYILSDMENLVPSKGVVLEIGCGVGRMLRPLARRFEAVYGLDVSPEMISRARVRLADLPNVRVWTSNGSDLRPVKSGEVDLVISYLVFQHIPEASIVEAMIRDTFRVLKPGGIFKFQVAGRPDGEDAALAERQRIKDTWSGVNFSDPEIRAVVERLGFNLLSTCSVQPPDSCIFLWVVAQKPPS